MGTFTTTTLIIFLFGLSELQDSKRRWLMSRLHHVDWTSKAFLKKVIEGKVTKIYFLILNLSPIFMWKCIIDFNVIDECQILPKNVRFSDYIYFDWLSYIVHIFRFLLIKTNWKCFISPHITHHCSAVTCLDWIHPEHVLINACIYNSPWGHKKAVNSFPQVIYHFYFIKNNAIDYLWKRYRR